MATIDDIPMWAREETGRDLVTVHEGDIMWTSGHLVVVLSPTPGLTIGPTVPGLVRGLGSPVGELCRPGAAYPSPPYAEGRVMNGGVYDARYVDLVEALFPGCTWTACPGTVIRGDRPARAWVDGKMVALVVGTTDKPPSE